MLKDLARKIGHCAKLRNTLNTYNIVASKEINCQPKRWNIFSRKNEASTIVKVTTQK